MWGIAEADVEGDELASERDELVEPARLVAAAAEVRSLFRHADLDHPVAMTANAMAGDRDRCLAAGMDDYLAKPIQRQLLADTLARWLPAAPDLPQ
ncbi:MAG TPA: hypothetical protein VFU46_00875 [Gemmatimonadales bacterium]|nr:hypothetical protein [Gemmatimonadales bacterium]